MLATCTFNDFDLRFFADGTPLDEAAHESTAEVIHQRIWIDGRPVEQGHPVDLISLVRSLYYPGEFYIFTCGCGNAGCAGIWDGVLVRHEPHIVRWRLRRPVSSEGFGNDFSDDYEQWKGRSEWIEYAFDRDIMIATIAERLAAVRRHPMVPDGYSPYGVERRHLEALDPRGRLCDVPWEDHDGPSLFFLADESHRFLLDGRFVAHGELPISEAYRRRLANWLEGNHARSREAGQRLAWLEELRALLLDAYRNGLPRDFALWLMFWQVDEQGRLDVWHVEKRTINVEWLNTFAPLPFPFVCLAADHSCFRLWMDHSPEAKESHSNFISQGGRSDVPLMLPFALEEELSRWAEEEPTTSADGTGIASNEGRDSANADAVRWARFHQEGIQLAERIQALVGTRATVVYERSWSDTATNLPRRIAVGR